MRPPRLIGMNWPPRPLDLALHRRSPWPARAKTAGLRERVQRRLLEDTTIGSADDGDVVDVAGVADQEAQDDDALAQMDRIGVLRLDVLERTRPRVEATPNA